MKINVSTSKIKFDEWTVFYRLQLMASVRSTLIHTCMDSIHKQLEQLEQWLNNVPDQPNQPAPSPLAVAIERLSKQFEVQQHALNHIVDRLDILEGMRDHPSYLSDEPWLDSSSTQLQNDIIDPLEPLYNIRKTDTLFEPAPIASAAIVATTLVATTLVAESTAAVDASTSPPVIASSNDTQSNTGSIVSSTHAIASESQQNEVVEPVSEPIKEPDTGANDAEMEEEEEDASLETIEYKGIAYYKDSEGFIYRIDEDEQPSDTAIGYWKEKTQTIAFYKK